MDIFQNMMIVTGQSHSSVSFNINDVWYQSYNNKVIILTQFFII